MSTGDLPTQRWQFFLVGAIFAAVLLHSAAVALWASPENSLRNAVGHDRLAFYVNPYFQQNWSNLNPRMQRADESLEIRAVIIHPTTSEEITTAWVNPVEADLNNLSNPVSWFTRSRADDIARLLATNYNASVNNLGLEHLEILAEDYVDRPLRDLGQALLEDGARGRVISRYLLVERILTSYATMYADAYWDGRVAQIQVRTGLREVPRDRSVLAEDLPFTYYETGWRMVSTVPEESLRVFANYVENHGGS